jgi:hypothetical protein
LLKNIWRKNQSIDFFSFGLFYRLVASTYAERSKAIIIRKRQQLTDFFLINKDIGGAKAARPDGIKPLTSC